MKKAFTLIFFILIARLFAGDIELMPLEGKRYRIQLPKEEEGVSYWIYSSSHWDFIPNPYLEEDFTSFQEAQQILFTDQQEVIVDGIHPFLRVVSEKEGVLSLPTALICPNSPKVRFPLAKKRVPNPCKILKQLKPYLLPEDHPLKWKLDRIFSSSRVLLNLKTLRAAGFETAGPRKFTKIVVATHSDFPHYIFKLYLDAQRFEKSLAFHEYLLLRIQGAKLIQETIDKNGWESFFKVPKKWLYALPESPTAPSEFLAKNFLLVEDNMNIYSDETNDKLWKSDQISKEFLQIYFRLLTLTGYQDVKPANTPFSLDGKVAFVDTQSFQSSVNYKKMIPFLSAENQKYWKELMDNNSPK